MFIFSLLSGIASSLGIIIKVVSLPFKFIWWIGKTIFKPREKRNTYGRGRRR